MDPDMLTGADHRWPKAALLAQIALTGVPFGNWFWYHTLIIFPAASTVTLPEYALLPSTTGVDQLPAKAGTTARKVTTQRATLRSDCSRLQILGMDHSYENSPTFDIDPVPRDLFVTGRKWRDS